MKYTQANPVPIPPTGTHQSFSSPIETTFDWQYALGREKLMALYEKGKAATWNATELDCGVEVNIERNMRERKQAGFGGVLNRVMQPPKQLDTNEQIDLQLNMNAFMLSQFLHGEQGAWG